MFSKRSLTPKVGKILAEPFASIGLQYGSRCVRLFVNDFTWLAPRCLDDAQS